MDEQTKAANPASENFRNNDDRIRTAVEFKLTHPKSTWAEVAKTVEITERQLFEWRKSEQWEIKLREVAGEHVFNLVPSAIQGLLNAWEEGKGSAQAVDVLRSFGLLRSERLEVEHSGRDADLDRKLRDKIAELVRNPSGD